MKEPVSIFNDVIGPVMIGPSSSHTAASVRIGWMIRRMLKDQPEKVEFFFSDKGSLASCHEPQGTDMGLAGGLLGMKLEDPAMENSMALAAAAGIGISFTITEDPCEHPNTYVFSGEGGGRRVTGEALSTGGGMVEMKKINGFSVSFTGGFYETLLFTGRIHEDEAAALAGELAGTEGVRVKLLCRESGGAGTDCPERTEAHTEENTEELLILIESERPLPEEVYEGKIPDLEAIVLPPVLPTASFIRYDGLFNTAQEIKKRFREGARLSDAAIEYEKIRSGRSREEVTGMMEDIVEIMQRTLKKVSEDQRDYPDRILGPQACRLQEYASDLLPPVLKKILANTTLFMEAKSSMEVIVAAPTCGSCAVLPGTLITAADCLGLGKTEIVRAMFAAAMIGVVLAEHATIAGEVGGCQAECGSASGMAAAGLAELLGADASKALAAAGMALQNTFGMVCDPVAGRVEVPCLGKNIQAGMNALSSAHMAMAGYDPVIPFDETVNAFYEVGKSIAPELRCTCLGGLSVTPASAAIEKQLKERARAR